MLLIMLHEKRSRILRWSDLHLKLRNRKHLLSLKKIEIPIQSRKKGRNRIQNREKIYLHVAEFNTSAIRLYKKFGFVEVELQDDAGEWASRECRIIRMEAKRKI